MAASADHDLLRDDVRRALRLQVDTRLAVNVLVVAKRPTRADANET